MSHNKKLLKRKEAQKKIDKDLKEKGFVSEQTQYEILALKETKFVLNSKHLRYNFS